MSKEEPPEECDCIAHCTQCGRHFYTVWAFKQHFEQPGRYQGCRPGKESGLKSFWGTCRLVDLSTLDVYQGVRIYY